MASRIIHYIISTKILEKCSLDRNDFILGNLLPDAHDGTLYGNSHSHFRYIINGEYTKLPGIEYLRFKSKYSSHFDNSLILGYYCHLLSDFKWVQLFPSNLDSESKEFIALRKTLHNDFGALNKLLKNHYKLRPLFKFEIPDDLIITEVNKENVVSVLNGLESDIKSDYVKNLTMLTLQFIIDYIDSAVDFCIQNIGTKC